MKKYLLSMCLMLALLPVSAQSFQNVPGAYKWLSSEEVAFTYDGTYTGADDFSVYAAMHRVNKGVKAPEKYTQLPVHPDGAVNLTYSPDSTMLAFTRDNDLWVVDIASGTERRITSDGSDLILNGYASWVYYEEILGRPSKYKAFWWSPDSKKIGFYRFDNSSVPMFPIYSAKGQDGSLNLTRYPKVGETNPEVRIGIVDISKAFSKKKWKPSVVWADFDPHADQYFGIPFWGKDSQAFFVARMPREQKQLSLYSIGISNGAKKLVYEESYPTWINWMEEVIFTDEGLVMVRDFETGWQQVYFLSYDGGTLRRLTDGQNWNVHLVRADGDDVYFTSMRDAAAKSALYKASADGSITALTDPDYAVSDVCFSPDGKYFVARLSNFTTPVQVWLYETEFANNAWRTRKRLAQAKASGKSISYNDQFASKCFKVADMAGPDFNASDYALPELIFLTAEDGKQIPAAIVYPKGFDPSKKYPVHFEIYGGPDTQYVRDAWKAPNSSNQWWSENGIIHITADVRASGHNGREGVDLIFRNLTEVPVRDFVAWGKYMQSLPYVIPEKIGVEGFSFGGTMTTMLLTEHSDVFHYGIAGGGVYDWTLYDSHYTERFMDTLGNNEQGYKDASPLYHLASYPVKYSSDDGSVMLKITHGTGDDNVHFQNTIQLVDALEQAGKKFELMIYPDGMHGYRNAQASHSSAADREFWLKYLKDRK